MSRPVNAPDFTFSFPSGDMGTRQALAALRAFLNHRGLTSDVCGYVELAIAEVLNNVVEHAYPENANQGDVHLQGWHHGNDLDFEVSDNGAPMPDGRIPLGRPPEIDVAFDDLPEGGFGWFLIRTMVREINYERQGCTNRLRLGFDVAALS